jgi:hypothetical protein
MRVPALLAPALLASSCGPAPSPPVTTAAAAQAEAHVKRGPIIAGVTPREAWVTWETAERRGQGCGDGAPRLVLEAPGHPPVTVEATACGTVHHVHLTGLSPGTAYTFTLDHGSGHGGPVAGRFSTAPVDREAAFRFVVHGDNRDDIPGRRSTRPDHAAVVAAILKYDADAAFVLHSGDLAMNRAPFDGYQAFFDVERPLLASRALFPAVGNHEKLDTTVFDALVNVPSFTGASPRYYGSADWGGVHLVILDTFEAPKARSRIGPEQLRWLDGDLAAAEQAGQLVFAVSHQSPYSHCTGTGGCHGGITPENGRDALVKTLTSHHVAAIFAGHDHYYQRGREGEGCLVYFVAGGGGAPMYEPSEPGASDAPGVIQAKKLNSYVVVSVKGHAATFEAKGVDGAVIDSGVLAPPPAGPCPK